MVIIIDLESLALAVSHRPSPHCKLVDTIPDPSSELCKNNNSHSVFKDYCRRTIIVDSQQAPVLLML